MKVQIILPSVNLWDKYARQAIESIQVAMVRAKEHKIDCRLLFIDNASTDNTKIEAGKMVSDLFSHVRNEERWGFQKSVNFGINDAFERGYDIAFVCNSDVVLHPEAIWRIVERFEKGDISMVTCMDVRGEMLEKKLEPWNIGSLNANEKESVEEAPHPNFSAFAVNKECWDYVGEFDELFAPAYFEDNDFHYRMKLSAQKGVVYPPAMFYHYGSRTQNESAENGLPVVSGGMFENNRAFYAKKWGGVPGSETFLQPYNDPTNHHTLTKQTK